MKNLFWSLFAFSLILVFTSCEKTPADPFQEELAEWDGVASNCYLYSAKRQPDAFGMSYTFLLMSNELSYKNKVWSGDGDFLTLNFYGDMLYDGFPVNKKYTFLSYQELLDEDNECLVGGYVQKGVPYGTYAYDVDEATQTAAGLLCTDGYVLCSGTMDDAKIIAVLTFLTPEKETVQREYIFNGKVVFN